MNQQPPVQAPIQSEVQPIPTWIGPMEPKNHRNFLMVFSKGWYYHIYISLLYKSLYQNLPISHLCQEEPLRSLQHGVVHIVEQSAQNISFLCKIYHSDPIMY